MHRSSKRIVTPLFLLLVAAAIFVPEVRADGLVNFNIGTEISFTLPQDAVPDWGSVSGDDFKFLMIPVIGLGHTFDMHFFKLFNSANPSFDTTNLIMECDPFIFGGPDANKVCDYFNWYQMDGNVRMWTNADGHAIFIPGSYDDGEIVISMASATAAPEPSTLALLLMS